MKKKTFDFFFKIFVFFTIFYFFWFLWFIIDFGIFLKLFFWIFDSFWIFLKDIFRFFRFFGIFWIFWIFFEILNFSLDFLVFFGISFKVNKVTTKSYRGYYWAPKIAKNWPKQDNKLSFFCPRAKKASAEGQSPPQELEVGPCSGPYLLVSGKGPSYLRKRSGYIR